MAEKPTAKALSPSEEGFYSDMLTLKDSSRKESRHRIPVLAPALEWV